MGCAASRTREEGVKGPENFDIYEDQLHKAMYGEVRGSNWQSGIAGTRAAVKKAMPNDSPEVKQPKAKEVLKHPKAKKEVKKVNMKEGVRNKEPENVDIYHDQLHKAMYGEVRGLYSQSGITGMRAAVQKPKANEEEKKSKVKEGVKELKARKEVKKPRVKR